MRSRKTQTPKLKTQNWIDLLFYLIRPWSGWKIAFYLPEVSHLMRTTFATMPRWWITVAALTVTAILLSPFYWVLIGSFMSPAELFGSQMSLWPRHFVVENWSVA